MKQNNFILFLTLLCAPLGTVIAHSESSLDEQEASLKNQIVDAASQLRSLRNDDAQTKADFYLNRLPVINETSTQESRILQLNNLLNQTINDSERYVNLQEFPDYSKQQPNTHVIESSPSESEATNSSMQPQNPPALQPTAPQSETHTSDSGWLSYLWNGASSSASSLKNNILAGGSYLYGKAATAGKGAATAAKGIFNIAANPYVAATTLYASGAGNRLANLAGWKYQNMSDYSQARPGFYTLFINLGGSLSRDTHNNPTIQFFFENHTLMTNKTVWSIFTDNQKNYILKKNFDNEYHTKESSSPLNIEKLFEILLPLLKLLPHLNSESGFLKSAFLDYGKALITIHTGIEDESGIAQSRYGNTVHIFNRRWLAPIETSLNTNDLNNRQKLSTYTNALFIGQLKNKISCLKYPIPDIENSLESLKSNDKTFLKTYYETDTPNIRMFDDSNYEIAAGKWNDIFTEVNNYISNYHPHYITASVTFEPKTQVFNENGISISLAPSTFYVKNINPEEIRHYENMKSNLSLISTTKAQDKSYYAG